MLCFLARLRARRRGRAPTVAPVLDTRRRGGRFVGRDRVVQIAGCVLAWQPNGGTRQFPQPSVKECVE